MTTGRSVAAVVLATAVAALCAGTPSPAGARTAPIAREAQQLVALRTTHLARVGLLGHPSQFTAVPASRPITGVQTVLPVVDRATRADGTRWLRVMLPGRPNGSRGWIAQQGTVLTSTRWRVVVKTASRRVLVYRDGRLARSFAAIVGKPSTPTPQGQFFVEESIRMLPGAPGAPFALATSARSNVLQEFDGGPGQIGIHGVGNLGGTPGTAVSHGCVRLSDEAIRWVAARIGPGVPVTMRS
jgi:lipoprotein-anchoring transpeptidase ErfK/SrfK